MPIRHHKLCVLAVATGAVLVTTGIILTGLAPTDILVIGVVTLHASLARLAVWPALKPQVDLYQAGYELGHDHGWHEGRKVGRPVLVPLRDEARMH